MLVTFATRFRGATLARTFGVFSVVVTMFVVTVNVVHARVPQDEPERTKVEFVEVEPLTRQKFLGTKSYAPSAMEKPYWDKLARIEKAAMVPFQEYDLAKKDGVDVGWFGIVRNVREDTDAKRTVVTLEHKYFNGLTDLHILVVNFNGSGDFAATLNGVGHGIKPLALVRVYGKASVADGEPRIASADFIRQWDWGSFSFITAMGPQRGSERWRKLNKVPLDKIYSAYPNRRYYVDRLGPRSRSMTASSKKKKSDATTDDVIGDLTLWLRAVPRPDFFDSNASPNPSRAGDVTPMPRESAWLNDDARALGPEDLTAVLLDEGVRRRDRRDALDAFQATTRIVIRPAEDAWFADIGLFPSTIGRQDIAIRDVVIATGREGVAPYPFGEATVETRARDRFRSPRLKFEGPSRFRRRGHEPRESSWRRLGIFDGTLDRKGREISQDDLEAEIRKLVDGGTEALTLVVEGWVLFREVTDLVVAIRAAGMTNVSVSDGRLGMPSGMRSGLAELRGFGGRRIDRSGLDKTVARLLGEMPGARQPDDLWFRSRERDPASKRPRALWDRHGASAVILAALFGEKSIGEDDRRREDVLTSLRALHADVDGTGVHGPSDGSTFSHAWILLASVRALASADVGHDARDQAVVKRLVRHAEKLRLASGAWSRRPGDDEPHLETSAVMMTALAEAHAMKVPGTRPQAKHASWLAKITDAKTGRVFAQVPHMVAFGGIGMMTFQQWAHGRHPEVDSAFSAAIRLAAGEKPAKGLLAMQLDRLAKLPTATDVATAYLDFSHTFFASWIARRTPKEAWSTARRALLDASNHYLEMRANFGRDGGAMRDSELLPRAFIALAVQHLR